MKIIFFITFVIYIKRINTFFQNKNKNKDLKKKKQKKLFSKKIFFCQKPKFFSKKHKFLVVKNRVFLKKNFFFEISVNLWETDKMKKKL